MRYPEAVPGKKSISDARNRTNEARRKQAKTEEIASVPG
jgi:hypothetical protein